MWIVMGTISMATLGLAIALRSNDATEASLNDLSRKRAKNVAASVSKMYINKLSQKLVSAPNSYSVPSIMDGEASVQLTAVSTDTVLIRTIGTYKGFKDTVKAYCVLERGVPLITAAVALSTGSTAFISQTGSSLVDGHNHSLAGTLDNSHPSTYGIAVSNNGSLGNVSIDVATNVTGKAGSYPDLAVDVATPTISDYVDAWIAKAQHFDNTDFNFSPPTETLGSISNPKITYLTGTCKLSGTQTYGAGILIVDGPTTFTGSSMFTGLVVVRGGAAAATIELTGSSQIIGATFVDGASTVFSMTGTTSKVLYSWEALDTVVKPLTGSNNSVRVASWWE